MTTLDDLYVYYCRRCACQPNSRLRAVLRAAYAEAGEERVLPLLDLSNNYVGPKGFQPIMMLVANLDSVEVLDASDNMLAHESIEALVDAASKHRGLREVRLARNAFHDETAPLLLHLLRSNWRITACIVDGNSLTPNSLEKIDVQLQRNRLAVQQALAEDELVTADQRALRLTREKNRYTPWKAQVGPGIAVERHRSGGSLNFASWRRNPQYQLFTSHSAKVTITLTIDDPQPTKLCGFVVLRGDSMRRVVDVSSTAAAKAAIVAESGFEERAVTMTLTLPAAPRRTMQPYVVVPCAFQPEKPFSFTLTASIPPQDDAPDGPGLVTLAEVDSRGDWFTSELDGEWGADSAGGSIANPSWRHSTMYRLRYTGGKTVGPARLVFVFSKSNDDEENDDREIGLYLLQPDSKGRRPVRVGVDAPPGAVVAALDHKREAVRVFAVDVPFCDAASLDLFVCPTTATPNQFGTYACCLYSTCPLDVDTVPYGRGGWATQPIRGGVWDARRCGGCRAENPTTWTNTPCYEVTVDGDGAVDLHVVLIGSLEREGGQSATLHQRHPRAPSASNAAAGGGGASSIDDVGLLLVRADADLAPVAQSPWRAPSQVAVELYVNDLDPGRYYLVPTPRLAGRFGTFDMELSAAPRIVHVGLETPLAVRLRERQLKRYEEENDARRKAAALEAEAEAEATEPNSGGLLPQGAGVSASAMANGSSGAAGAQPVDLAVAAQVRAEVMATYHTTGEKFVDRDFPRGASSLWKNAVEQPTSSSANVADWVRASELSLRGVHEDQEAADSSAGDPGAPRLLPKHPEMDPGVVPNGVDASWIHSALAMVLCRPALYRRLVVANLPQYGLFQFRFFKNGAWTTVTIDDYLPVDAAGALCFAWPLPLVRTTTMMASSPSCGSSKGGSCYYYLFSLVEKALAKLHRCYEALDLAASVMALGEEAEQEEEKKRGVATGSSARDHGTAQQEMPPGYSPISRALVDFTGGMAHEKVLYDAPGKQWCYRGLWSTLQSCRDGSRLVGLRLSAATPRAAEKKHSGLFIDRLYPVLDAREVEGVKLVKVRTVWGWGTQDAVHADQLGWAGKYGSAPSSKWTSAMRQAVGYDPTDSTCVWLSAEEVMFYFGVVHVVELDTVRAWVHGAFAANAPGGDPTAAPPPAPPSSSSSPSTTFGWPHNPQFALRVSSAAAQGEEPDVIPVTFGLHQPDALMTIPREDTGRADYRGASLSLVVIRTDDDLRKLVTLTDTEVVYRGPIGVSQRDAFATIPIDRRHKYIVMPFNADPGREAAFLVSATVATASGRRVALAPIGSDLTASVDGEWDAVSAGGPPTHPTWRSNPQFLVHAAEGTKATIVLHQRNATASTADHIGFTVVAARDIRRCMNVDACDVVASAPHRNSQAVSQTVRLQATRDRLGMPYVVIPSTNRPGVQTGFTLQVISNTRVTVRPLDTELDYRRHVVTGAVGFEAGNAGGSPAHSSWRCNPQYVVSFPVQRAGKLIATLAKRDPSAAAAVEDDDGGDDGPGGGEEMALYAFQSDPWDHGRRRKLVLRGGGSTNTTTTAGGVGEDILAIAPATTGQSTELTVEFAKGSAPMILMPCNTTPFSALEYELRIFCTCDFSLRPVDEWASTTDVSGSWDLGTTAGGSRTGKHRSWINNPFFGLSVTRPTRVVILALQYPRGPERAVVRRVGAKRVLVPPPIVNERRKVCFGLDVCERDAMGRDFTCLHHVPHTHRAEAVLVATLEACDAEPYYLVPNTFDPEEEADFRLFVYSDTAVQVLPINKERKAY